MHVIAPYYAKMVKMFLTTNAVHFFPACDCILFIVIRWIASPKASVRERNYRKSCCIVRKEAFKQLLEPILLPVPIGFQLILHRYPLTSQRLNTSYFAKAQFLHKLIEHEEALSYLKTSIEQSWFIAHVRHRFLTFKANSVTLIM